MRRAPKHFLLLAPLFLAAGLAAPSFSRSASEAASFRDGGELHDHMESISSGLKAMRRTLSDPALRAESLATLLDVQRNALEAKQGVPPMAESLPEAERPAFVVGFRKLATELLAKTLALEVALLDGDQAAIDAAYKELRAMEDKGHERFTEDG